MNLAPKESVDELAALGGRPLFHQQLNVGVPNLPARDAFFRRVDEIFGRRRLTNKGPFVIELEKGIAAFLGVKHCVCVSNGTRALEILIKVLGCTGEIICPSFTFVASAHALHWMGLRPVFCDIDPQTHNIDPVQAETLIGTRTSGILGVHVWGRPCPVEELTRLAREHGLTLVFDAAHAFGASAGGRRIGSFGEAEVFSFHATKVFHTFEGGAITTNDDELADRCRLAKNFGFKGYDHVIAPGTNGKMSEVHAAMGAAMLELFPAIVEQNEKRYWIYQRGLGSLEGVRLMAYDEKEENNFQYVVIEIDEPRAGLSRDEILRLLHAENINARRYFYPGCHRMEPYRSDTSVDRDRLKRTEEVSERVICLPTGTGVRKEDVEQVARFIRFTVDNAKTIRPRLSSTAIR